MFMVSLFVMLPFSSIMSWQMQVPLIYSVRPEHDKEYGFNANHLYL